MSALSGKRIFVLSKSCSYRLPLISVSSAIQFRLNQFSIIAAKLWNAMS